MKTLICPRNGRRNISEFICGGEVKDQPDPHACRDEEWADFVFLCDNHMGVVREWWCHAPTNYWFIVERDTVTEEIVKTYPAGTLFDQRIDFHRPDEGAKPEKARK